jgi:hypothetical protein
MFSGKVYAMTPEEHSIIERTLKLTEENNKILRSIRAENRLSMIMRIIYWVIILGISFGAYYLIQPYIDGVLGAYGDLQGGLESLQGNLGGTQSAASSLRDLIK